MMKDQFKNRLLGLWDWPRALQHMPMGWLAVGCGHLNADDFGAVVAVVMAVFVAYEYFEARHLAELEKRAWVQQDRTAINNATADRGWWRPNTIDDSFVDIQGALVGLVMALLLRGTLVLVL